jgi:hypothetical protein
VLEFVQPRLEALLEALQSIKADELRREQEASGEVQQDAELVEGRRSDGWRH